MLSREKVYNQKIEISKIFFVSYSYLVSLLILRLSRPSYLDLKLRINKDWSPREDPSLSLNREHVSLFFYFFILFYLFETDHVTKQKSQITLKLGHVNIKNKRMKNPKKKTHY